MVKMFSHDRPHVRQEKKKILSVKRHSDKHTERATMCRCVGSVSARVGLALRPLENQTCGIEVFVTAGCDQIRKSEDEAGTQESNIWRTIRRRESRGARAMI